MFEIQQPEKAANWLRVAEGDIKAARILYEKKLYAHAVFSTQQACEKIYKAYHFCLGYDENDMKRKGHLAIGKRRFEAANREMPVEAKKLVCISNYEEFGKAVIDIVKADYKTYETFLMFSRACIKHLPEFAGMEELIANPISF